MKKNFDFLSGELRLIHVKDESSLEITSKTIVLNNGCKGLAAEGYVIRPNKSVILSNCTLRNVDDVILCPLPADYIENAPHPHSEEIEKNWIRIYDYDLKRPETKVDLFRTEQVSIDHINLNFCFAKAGTDCGIHKEHGFMEFHTQVYGVGIMQMFYENSFDSFYLEEYMSPGYTHEAFHRPDITYPWHQYRCVSDCIWFVAEIGEKK